LEKRKIKHREKQSARKPDCHAAKK